MYGVEKNSVPYTHQLLNCVSSSRLYEALFGYLIQSSGWIVSY
jgi:hypothetical protein